MVSKINIPLYAATILSLIPLYSDASIILSGTRFIYLENNNEINVQIKNKGNMPALLQSWIDTGDSRTKAEKIETPFILTPPVTRVDPGQGQTLRIIYNKKPLPQDRESVFWINVLEIPSKAKSENNAKSDQAKNQLQLAFRTRVKLFFRPDNLPGEASTAPTNAKLALIKNAEGSEMQVVNESPYSISYSGFQLTRGSDTVKINGELVNAKENHNFKLPKKITGTGWQVEWFAVNDFGGEITGKKILSD